MKNLYIIKTLLSVTFYILYLQDGNAQVYKANSVGRIGEFSMGYGNMHVSALQQFIPSSVKNFGPGHLIAGGGGSRYKNNLIYGGSGYGVIGDLVKTEPANYNLRGGILSFDIGYFIYNREKVKIFPMLGLGGGIYGLQIAGDTKLPNTGEANSFYQNANITHKSFIVDASINIRLFSAAGYKNYWNSNEGIVTGLKIGYTYSLQSSYWNFSEGNLTSAPRFGYNMPYIKLVLGGFENKIRANKCSRK